MTTTLGAMVADLKVKSQVQTSENFADPSFFESLIISAGKKHNSSYAISTTACSVPDLEAEAVTLLAWIDFCFIRASRFASSPGSSQQGFSTNRDTPYYKLIDLAKQLKSMYAELCGSIGLVSFYGAGSPVMSEVTCENLDLGAMTPIEISLNAPTPALSTVPSDRVAADGTIVLNWMSKDFNNFAAFFVLQMTGAESVLQPWNYASSSSIPGIHDSASLVGRVNRAEVRSVKLQGLTITPGTINRFVVVTATKSGKFAYSNEVVLTQP